MFQKIQENLRFLKKETIANKTYTTIIFFVFSLQLVRVLAKLAEALAIFNS